MSNNLRGLYVITDDTLTPDATLFEQVEAALKGGATIVQLRDKHNPIKIVREKAIKIQKLCHQYHALFVLNDKVDMAIELQCDGLHIGKSDHERFDEIRKAFKGIIGISCYADIPKAKDFQDRGADYVAFGSFYTSPTKPTSNIIPLEIIRDAKKQLHIPVCAIGGININYIADIMEHKPDMVSIISDIWNAENIEKKSKFYTSQFH
ncbi:MAG: thiamine phosphate synthase [Campylobacterota bacterium]|nr:thiamine phosphate synthase [Campylobacterota bacterium]